MYRHCIFCRRDLGHNETIEPFPVGQRLAFDPGKGRLWVICPRCSRWNLTPIEERWEAIEDCERRYRSTPRRVSTGEIGWTRVKEGLELVRIGQPVLPEFAGWRYGRWLTRRRTSLVVGTVAVAGTTAAATLSAPVAVGVAAVLALPGLLVFTTQQARSPIPRVWVRSESGEILSVSRLHMPLHALRPIDEGSGWQLEVVHADGTTRLRGNTGVQALLQLLPTINATGAPGRRVEAAVSAIERSGEGARYLQVAAAQARSGASADSGRLCGLPRTVRLALEIAANEERERSALNGELALLEQAWRDAEGVAAIADSL